MGMAHNLSEIESLFISPKRNYVPLPEPAIIDCPKCKVGNRIVEGQSCGVCEKLEKTNG